MSYGLVCLNCRRYIVERKEHDKRHHCVCPEPAPSWDAKTLTTVVPDWLRATRADTKGEEPDGDTD